MSSCHLRRFGAYAAVLAGVLTAGTALGQDLDGDAGAPSAARPAVLIRALPPVEVERYDGSIGVLAQEEVWRSMCGSAGLSVDELAAAQANHAAMLSNAEEVIVIDSGTRTPFNMVFQLSPSVPAAAIPAFQTAEAYLEALFNDPITVSVDVSFQNLGSGVLGATGSSYVSDSYSDSRNGLVFGMDENDLIQEWLPTGNTIPVRYDGTTGNISSENRIFWTRAAYNSTVGSVGGDAAGMTYNTQFNWDWDPSDGVSGYSFQDVIIHEVGHALGFTSAVDFRNSDMEVLDVYRFPRNDGPADWNPDTYQEFESKPRLVDFNTPNDDHNSDLIDFEYRMSDGNPWQASHFREGCCGLMDPALGFGQTFYPDFFTAGDLNMFDAIGYDYPVCPGPVITTQPEASQQVCPGDTVFLFVEVVVDGFTVVYQWQRDGANLVNDGTFNGVNSPVLTISGITPADVSETYRCVITRLDNGCSSTSNSAGIALGTTPTVATDPVSQTVDEGELVLFTAGVQNPLNPQYQWRKDGVSLVNGGTISGVNNSTLIIASAVEANEGVYDCVITETDAVYECTEVTTAGATLTVNPAAITCAGDLNGDSRTDFDDFSVLVNGWGGAGGDLNGDNTTDFDDFSIIVNDWNCDEN